MLLNIFVLSLFFVTLIVFITVYHRKNNVALSKPLPLPTNSPEMNQYTKRFNAEWPSNLETKISKNMLNEFPHISAKELPDLWYELKTYLYLASLVKTVPMFSKEIDLIWHEMLEHEKEYNAFCNRFCGHVIEHNPHDTPMHLPKERAFFNILYQGMFPSYESNRYWGSFLSEKEQMLQWISRIDINTNELYEETRNKKASSLGNKVYLNFLESNLKEIKSTKTIINEKNLYNNRSTSNTNDDLIWLYSLGTISATFYSHELKEEKNNTSTDGVSSYDSGGYDYFKKPGQNSTDNNDNSSSQSSFDSNSTDSNSSSSCSSSSCSSCSSCSS